MLTSGGVTNPSIHSALVQLLGKPIAESHALANVKRGNRRFESNRTVGDRDAVLAADALSELTLEPADERAFG